MKIGIIGLGLIGGSLGRAIIKKTEHTVFGYDTNPDSLLRASLMNAYHEELTEDNVKSVDLLIIALSPMATINAMRSYAPRLKRGAIIIDCCGNKRIIAEEMTALSSRYPQLDFIGVHPMAGREFSGISHSTAGLFERAYIIFTPIATPIAVLDVVKKLFLALGAANVVVTDPETHDRTIAYTSQLAHLVSSAYVKNPLSGKHVGFSAGSFRDMTRVAKLSSELWTELFLENADMLIPAVDDIIERLTEYKTAIAAKDEAKLKALLEDGTEKKELAEKARHKD